ncbi:hypothetical protein PAPYR_8914 [Paratrimastix pyriformis]|uniref:Uncharacterized protein n=1 Tax=Paratrimastix pyriformis TaxID=342808 RepID=A0ABQ8UB63_9EUKA|nr:hypothetical protein PAPYR_8914 [Paratrimastix pyriformis]
MAMPPLPPDGGEPSSDAAHPIHHAHGAHDMTTHWGRRQQLHAYEREARQCMQQEGAVPCDCIEIAKKNLGSATEHPWVAARFHLLCLAKNCSSSVCEVTSPAPASPPEPRPHHFMRNCTEIETLCRAGYTECVRRGETPCNCSAMLGSCTGRCLMHSPSQLVDYLTQCQAANHHNHHHHGDMNAAAASAGQQDPLGPTAGQLVGYILTGVGSALMLGSILLGLVVLRQRRRQRSALGVGSLAPPVVPSGPSDDGLKSAKVVYAEPVVATAGLEAAPTPNLV